MKTKRILQIAVACLAVVLVLCIGMLVSQWYADKKANDLLEQTKDLVLIDPPKQDNTYQSPIDFEQLQQINNDIYAWIQIPGTNVDHPVVQHPNDNNFYLARNIQKEHDAAGSLFTETYNTKTFEDQVTLIYGHNMKSGAMFGQMKQYSNQTYFDANNEMTIYLPDQKKEYVLVAATPFDDRHILFSYDFTKQEEFYDFVSTLLHTRNINARYAQDTQISSEDRLVILSTCYFNQVDMRYLVVFKEKRS